MLAMNNLHDHPPPRCQSPGARGATVMPVGRVRLTRRYVEGDQMLGGNGVVRRVAPAETGRADMSALCRPVGSAD
jgi:hypothetical protein